MSADYSNLPNLQHSIPLSEAVAMTRRYRENRPLILKPDYPTEILTLSETFNKDAVVALGNTPGAAGIRIYYGMDDSLLCHAILVAVNDQGEDILPPADAATGTGGALTVTDDPIDILEDSIRCPDICPPDSPLNG